MKEQFIDLIRQECAKVGVEPEIFIAICEHESIWRVDAMRYENNFQWLYQPALWAKRNFISLETETQLQKMSYSLCQIMGSCAREMGYDKMLTDLLDPVDNIQIGVKFFKLRCDKYPDVKDKIASWNAGSPSKKNGVYGNQEYVDKVYPIYLQYVSQRSKK